MCVYFVQLGQNPLTSIGALTLLRTVKNNTKSAVEEIDISVSAAKLFSPQRVSVSMNEKDVFVCKRDVHIRLQHHLYITNGPVYVHV